MIFEKDALGWRSCLLRHFWLVVPLFSYVSRGSQYLRFNGRFRQVLRADGRLLY